MILKNTLKVDWWTILIYVYIVMACYTKFSSLHNYVRHAVEQREIT